MSEFVKGEMKTDGQDAINKVDVDGTEVAHMCSNFDWTVRRATAKELVRRWNAFEGLLDALKQISDIEDARFTHAGFDLEVNNIAKAAIAKV